jgi:hypothetical protein
VALESKPLRLGIGQSGLFGYDLNPALHDVGILRIRNSNIFPLMASVIVHTDEEVVSGYN